MLSQWCKKININFDILMLSWEKGNHKEDGIWWKHWYDNVINTTFQKYPSNVNISIENKFDSIYDESLDYYNIKELCGNHEFIIEIMVTTSMDKVVNLFCYCLHFVSYKRSICNCFMVSFLCYSLLCHFC